MTTPNNAAALERMFDAIDRVEALCAKSNKLDRERLLGRVMVNSADELSTLRAALLSREGMTNIVIGATRHYGGEAWFRELTVAGVTFLAPLDEQEKARGILSALTSQPSGESVGSTRGYFIYDGNQFDEVKSLQEAHRQAEEALSYFRDDAPDGWPDGVENICYGVILGRSIKTVERPAEPADNMEADIAVYADYEITHPSDDAPGVAVDGAMVERALYAFTHFSPVYSDDSHAMMRAALVAALAPKPEGGHG